MSEQAADVTVKRGIVIIVLKVAAIVAAFIALFSFVFGVYRVSDESMDPLLTTTDLVVYYRLDRSFTTQDLVSFDCGGHTTAGRVVAIAGDEVHIDDKGLKVNGNYQQETRVSGDTAQVADGVSFPLTVPEGSVFVLGDNRGAATDSRILGCISSHDVKGKVVAQVRRNGF